MDKYMEKLGREQQGKDVSYEASMDRLMGRIWSFNSAGIAHQPSSVDKYMALVAGDSGLPH